MRRSPDVLTALYPHGGKLTGFPRHGEPGRSLHDSYNSLKLYTYGMTAELHATRDLSGVVEIPLSEARERLGDLVDSVRDEDSFIYLTRRGKRVAALMPVDVAENYEKIEDEYWARRAAEAHDRLAAGEDEVIPFSELVAEAEGRS